MLLWFLDVVVAGPRLLFRKRTAALYLYGKLDRIVPPGTYTYNAGIEEYKICPISVLTLELFNQKVMTRDTVSISLDAVCFYQIINVQSALFNVRDYEIATKCLAQTTLEKLLAEHTLDELISSRTEIIQKTTSILDKHTSNWGIHVSGLEIRDIKIPHSIERALAVAAEAKRESDATIIMAQAEYQASETYVKAAGVMKNDPIALQLRYFRTLKEIGTVPNRTILFSSQLLSMMRPEPRWDSPISYPDPVNPIKK